MSIDTETAPKKLRQIFNSNKSGNPVGIYSVCSAHPIVLEAAFRQANNDQSLLLVEATANQVNQFGGYTSMTPTDFPVYVADIADKVGFDKSKLILGGDHLGPLCWTNESVEDAMLKASQLVSDYVSAGFRKIHLDTSMPCIGDDTPLSDKIVALRSATLCAAAEASCKDIDENEKPVYVIGTEVPEPGGATESIDELTVTTVQAAQRTIEAHKTAFQDAGLESAWQRVVALVVQPGVEFNHLSVHQYDRSAATDLKDGIDSMSGMVYEAHSTDYQPQIAYNNLVQDHFAILKVGPQLTFALREALFGLSAIEEELLGSEKATKLPSVCEEVMLSEPDQWNQHYPSGEEDRWYRKFSYSDRIRYYWNHPKIEKAVAQLLGSLSNMEIPAPLLSQYFPNQYSAIQAGSLNASPLDIVLHRIMEVTELYSKACGSAKTNSHTDLT